MRIPFDSPVKLLNIYNNGYLTFERHGITVIEKSNYVLIQNLIWTKHPSKQTTLT
jgi:hypothetical protein